MFIKRGIARGRPLDLDPLEPRLLLSAAAFPVPLTPVDPAGSLIYRGTATASIASAGELDTFTIALDAGQTVSLVAAPASTLRPTLELLAPDGTSLGSATASAAGGYALLQTLPAATAGTYTISLSGAASTTGTYSVSLTLNAALESESYGGTANDTLAAAQDIDGSFIALCVGSASRGTATGQMAAGGQDWYRFSLADGQSASLALKSAITGGASLALCDADGGVLALGTGTAGADGVIYDFVDTTSDGAPGVYFAKVTGTTAGEYGLAVTVDSALDAGAIAGRSALELLPPGQALGKTAWRQDAKFIAPDGTDWDYLGYSVAVSGDTAVVGAYGNGDEGNESGSAYIFRVDGAGWALQAKLVPPDGAASDYFGMSVSISGQTVIVGARGDDDKGDESGSAYVYHFDGTSWALQAKLTASDGTAGDKFGASVAVSGDRAVVGAYGDASGSGSAYFYRFDGTTWIQQAMFSGGRVSDFFGYAVAISGDTAVIGAYLNDTKGADAGSAYVFHYDGTAWTYKVGLLAADGAAGDAFGHSVAISGGTIIVGAGGDDDKGSSSGSAYLFGLAGTHWVQQAKLVPADGAVGDTFGYSVAISGDTAVIGAPGDDDKGQAAGAVYVYRFDGASWAQEAKRTASDGTTENRLGDPVAISGNRVIAGAYWAGTNKTGSAYTFVLSGSDYSVRAQAGDTLAISTATPADAGGEFRNILDPVVHLYDPTGAMVAFDDNGAPDGRNALLTYPVTLGGVYTVRVLAQGGSPAGEYVLSVTGQTASAEGFRAAGADIPDGTRLPSPPPTVRVDFSDLPRLTTLQAEDLTVNGVPAVGVTVTDVDTAVFTLPSLADGTYVAAIAAGAVVDLQGAPLEAFSLTFSVDTTPPRIVASSILEGQILPTGALVYTATFDEALPAANLDSSDVTLSGANTGSYVPSLFIYDPATNALTAGWSNLPEDAFTLTVMSGAGAVEDLVGNDLDGEPDAAATVPSGNGIAGGNFAVHFTTDYSQAVPVVVAQGLIAGALIHQTTLAAGIYQASDGDTFSLDLDARQAVSLVLTPAASLAVRVELRDAGGTLAASGAGAAGAVVAVQAPALAEGHYTILVQGLPGTDGLPTLGRYSLQATLGAELESESHGGPANDSRAAAQDLESAFDPLSGGVGQRAGVMGTLTSASRQDYYAFTLADGQKASAVLAGTPTRSLTLQLYSAAGTLLATGQNASSADTGIRAFTDTTANGAPDTYYLRVSSTVNVQYALALTRGALLETFSGDIGEGLVSYWSFDEGAGAAVNDAAGGGNDGQVNGPAWTTRAGGGALHFDGVDDYVALGNAASLQFTGQITLSAWIRVTGFPSGIGNIIAHGYTGYLTPDTPAEVFFRLNNGYYQVGSWSDAGNFLAQALIPAADNGQWIHLAGTWANGVWSLFRNGVFVGQSNSGTTGAVLVTGAGWAVGANGTADARFFSGDIDEPRIYTCALAAQEIALLAGTQSFPSTAQALPDALPVVGVVSSPADTDYYALALQPGDTATLSTLLPGGGAGQFVNNLDPALELYNPAGTLIASNDNGAPDGRNALLAYTAQTAGTYLVKLRGAAASVGEYVLTAHVVPDTTAPAVTVARRLTDDRTSALAGTVDDPQAAIDVAIEGVHYAAVNHGDGTWSLADDAIAAPLAWGIHEVTVTATDLAANAGQDASAGELTVYRLLADANFDGTVNLEDFGLLKDNFGLTPRSWSQGDFNGDGLVNLEDFGLLKDHFGLSAPLEAAPTPPAAFLPQTHTDETDDAPAETILDALAAAAPQLVLRVPTPA